MDLFPPQNWNATLAAGASDALTLMAHQGKWYIERLQARRLKYTCFPLSEAVNFRLSARRPEERVSRGSRTGIMSHSSQCCHFIELVPRSRSLLGHRRCQVLHPSLSPAIIVVCSSARVPCPKAAAIECSQWCSVFSMHACQWNIVLTFVCRRCVVQLGVLGYVILVPIFTTPYWFVVVLYALLMCVVGAFEAFSRPAYSFKVHCCLD